LKSRPQTINREARLATPIIQLQPAVAHLRCRRKSRDASIADSALQWKDIVLYRNMPIYNQYDNIINPIITTNYEWNISTHQLLIKAVQSRTTFVLLHNEITVIFSSHNYCDDLMFVDTGSININIHVYTQQSAN